MTIEIFALLFSFATLAFVAAFFVVRARKNTPKTWKERKSKSFPIEAGDKNER
jgi:hypothetical protein